MKFISILSSLLVLGAVCCDLAQSQWVFTGPFGGPVQSLVVRNRTGESTAFAISSLRGVFRSTDMGDHWIPVSTGLPGTAAVYTQAFAVDDTNLWVGIPWSGVYRSTDDGASWVETGLKKTVAAFATAQTASGQKLLYAAIEYKGLYLSSDNGMNWSELNDRIRDTTLYLDTVVGFVNGLAAFANAAGNMTLLAGVEYYGIFRSTDNGAHWTWPLLSDDVNAVDIVPEGNGGRTIYASAWDCIYKSTDDGETWARHTLAARGHVSGVVALPSGSNGTILLAGSDDGIFLSSDNGANWSPKDSGLANPYVRILGRLTGSGGTTAILAATGGGIFRSTNAGDLWVRACNGFGGTYAVSLAVFPDGAGGGTLFAGTQGDGMFRSTDYGNSWTSINAGLTTPFINSNAVAVCPNGVGDTNVFVGTNDGAFRSSNKGDNWLRVSNLGLNYPYVGQLTVSGTSLYSIINFAAYRLSNNTYSWLPLAGPPGGAAVIVAFPIGSDGTTLLASPNSQGVYRSTDNGANWYQFTTGMYTQYVTAFAVRGTNVFAGTDQGVYRADATLASWTSMSRGLINRMETSYVVCFATAPDGKGGQNLFVEYGTGIFGLGDNDTWWTAVDTSAFVWQVSALGSAGQYLFAVTSDGIWRRPLSDIVLGMKTAKEELPTEFRLEQNYPNPFNPETRIQYTVAGTGDLGLGARKTMLVVYDVLGREVATLVDEPKMPGNYEITFDGSGLASGVYIYQLRAGSFVQSRKMLLLR